MEHKLAVTLHWVLILNDVLKTKDRADVRDIRSQNPT